jgi:hypothetical protein
MESMMDQKTPTPPSTTRRRSAWWCGSFAVAAMVFAGCGDSAGTSGDANYSQKFDKPAGGDAKAEAAKTPSELRKER